MMMKIAQAWMLSIVTLIAPLGSGAATAEEATLPRSIMIGTASPGGGYYIYGQEVARILSRAFGIEAHAQVTQGSAQNIMLLERHEVQLAFMTMGVGLQAWNGADWAKGTKYRSMRVIFPMYDTPFQFVAPKRLAMKSLMDLTGRRVGLGPRSGTADIYIPEIFKILGINASLRRGTWDDMKSLTTAGELDAIMFISGVPFPALTELNAIEPIDFIEPSPEQMAIIRKQMPEFSPSVVPAGTYPSLLSDYHTFGLYSFVVVHKDFPEEIVYKIVKAVFEKREELSKVQPPSKETIPENISQNTLFPLHPGAVRYYREIGITIPPSALADQ